MKPNFYQEEIIPLSAFIRQAIKVNTLCKTCKFFLDDCRNYRKIKIKENGYIRIIDCENYIKEELI